MNTPKPIKSILETRESKESAERAKAEINIPDPSPERAKAILEKKEDDNDGSKQD